MRLRGPLTVGVAGLVAIAAVAVVLDIAFGDVVALAALSGGAALAVGLAAAVLLWLTPQARFGVQMAIVVVSGVAAVAAGAVAAVYKMLLPEAADRFVVVVIAAGTVGALVSLLLSGRVNRAQAELFAATRRLGEAGAVGGAEPPPIREFAALASELELTRRRLDEASRRERQAEAAQRELITWLSHDLRTPLAGIRALTEALQDGVVTDPPLVASYHERLQQQADRMADMVADLLALSRLSAGATAGRPPRVSLTDLISDAAASVQPLADRAGVRLEVGGEGPLEVSAAPAEVARILENLLCNAVRETPRDGRVALTASRRADVAEVVVSDECGGLSPESLRRVFDAGYRASAARTPEQNVRAGLGLTIARGLAQARGGTLEVTNVAGGCAFTLRLPAATEADVTDR